MLHRISPKETRDRWFDVENVASYLVAKGAPCTGVPTSIVVEVGYARYSDKSQDVGLPYSSRTPPPFPEKQKRNVVEPVPS